MKPNALITLFLMMAVLFQSPIMAAPTQPAADSELQAWLAPVANDGDETSHAAYDNALTAVARFYRMIDYRPVWVDANGLRPQGKTLWTAIVESSADGLRPDDYLLPALLEPWNDRISFSDTISLSSLKPLVRLDAALTEVMLRYATHLSTGRIRPETMTPIRIADPQPGGRDLPAELATAVKEDRLNAFLENLRPKQAAYRRLGSTLQQHERTRETGGWPAILSAPPLRLGDRNPGVAVLRSRLKRSGDLTADLPVDDDRFDQSLEAAVMRFQYRHGLARDGVVGKKTLAALDVPIEERILQLQLNMERWRWYPDSLGQRYLMVNIPDYSLSVMEGDGVVRRMRAIVGQSRRQTPTLSGRMTYLEFNPFWNIPPRIARRDILPKIQNDPDYLIRQGIKVFGNWEEAARELNPFDIRWEQVSGKFFPYRLRQEPSNLNALGQVKFMFPNEQSVYIHDTPDKSLFFKDERSFSSGCVRVENPIALAHYLLSEQGWDSTRLESTIARGARRTIVLDRPIPVHLVYFTAWVDGDGTVHFRDDIYGRDRQLLLALTQGASDLIVCGNDTGNSHLLAACATTGKSDRSMADGSGRVNATPLETAGKMAGHPMTGL